jgi:hypothetical protein
MSATEQWRERIEAHNAQTMRARAGRDVPDLWAGLAGGFQDDPRRTGDPIIDLVAGWLTPQSTLIDVGGGAGRHALPFALRCKHVTVVEPSPAMQSALAESAKSAGIENYSVVASGWEDAEVEPADVVFCAHVVYALADIEPFVRKLQAKSRDAVAIVLAMQAPLTRMSAFWKAAYQEDRIDLPGLPELVPVLWEMGLEPNITMGPTTAGRMAVPNVDTAIAFARHFLYIEPGSEADKRLLAALPDLVEETPEGITMRQWQPPSQGVIWWRNKM